LHYPPSCLLINTTPTSHIYTLSLHDALPIFLLSRRIDRPQADQTKGRHHREEGSRVDPRDHPLHQAAQRGRREERRRAPRKRARDRKSTRLNSSHLGISYAVFCLKKKKHKRK